jgi:predicted transposase YbfD/YdcC
MDISPDLPSPSRLKKLICDSIPDPRVMGRTSHPLVNILVLGLASILCGGESFPDMVRFAQSKEEFFRCHLDMSCGIPSHDTFERVFEVIEPDKLGELLVKWVVPSGGGQVAIDGKTVRSSKRGQNKAIHLVNAYAKDHGLVLAQRAVEEKTNEITVLPEIIRSLDLEGCVVSIDAAGCQRAIAREIHEADADYLLALKANQGNAYQEITTFLKDLIARGELQAYQEADKGHGRLELRRYFQTDALDWFADRAKWENLRSVVAVEARREHSDGHQSIQWRYYLSSLPVDLPRVADLVRGHWSVENNLHWVLDVTFGEDRSQKGHKIAAQNLALMRKLALNILKSDTSHKDAIKGKRLRAGWNNNYLAKLLEFDA